MSADTCSCKFKDDQSESQRLFTLSSGLQTVEALTESLDSQPRGQPYLKVPCDPGCQCGRPHSLERSLMLSVDGTCRGDGTPGAQAAIAVFFRNDSPYNKAAKLTVDNPTSQRAELYAGIMALEIFIEKMYGRVLAGLKPLKDVQLVVLRTDSDYLVKGMTEWIYTWQSNGWINVTGSPVANADLFERLDDLIDAIKDEHVTVKFLHVRRELNAEADKLANHALDAVPRQPRQRC